MIRLRPYKPCDAEAIASWIKSEYVFRQWGAEMIKTYPVTAESLNEHYGKFENSNTFWAMTAFEEDKVVGHMIMRFPDANKDTIRFGFIIVDDSKRGKGYGKEMLKLALTYAEKILKVKRVTLGVFDNNDSAYNCYSSAGFKIIPSKKEFYNIGDEIWSGTEMEVEF